MMTKYDENPKRYWKTGVANQSPFNIHQLYRKKFNIINDKIMTAGSCFSQHIHQYLIQNKFNLLDFEPAPASMSYECSVKKGYNLFSARYGNIYTVRQLLQLAQQTISDNQHCDIIWHFDGKYYDALRPTIVCSKSRDEIIYMRLQHLTRVYKLFKEFDCFIFTLGLTEMWSDVTNGIIYPVYPEKIIPNFNLDNLKFINATYEEIVKDFNLFIDILKEIRCGREFKIILTVSPVPLIATAGDDHILVRNSYSKSILRTVAAHLCNRDFIDYFPSYEIVTNPRASSAYYDSNLRSIKKDLVPDIMNHFFSEHAFTNITSKRPYDIICEEEMLNVIAIDKKNLKLSSCNLQILGNSYLFSFKEAFDKLYHSFNSDTSIEFIPFNCLLEDWRDFERVQREVKYSDINWKIPLDKSQLVKEYISKLHLKESKKCNSKLWTIGALGLTRVTIMDLHPDQKPGLVDEKGIFIKGFRSGGIPIIKSVDDCDPRFVQNVEFLFRNAKKHLDYIINTLGQNAIRVVDAPMMSDKCARYWFGDDYVDSGVQNIYNTIINSILDKYLGSYVTNKNILLVDDSFYNDKGFVSNIHALSRFEYDMHVDHSAYANIVKDLLRF